MTKVPLSIALLTAFAGLTIAYWALVGFGIVKGSTPAERLQNLKGSVQS
jgi:hypothetical protein